MAAAGWRRALEEARRGEAEGKGRPQEERRLAPRELGRGGHQLLEILLAQRIGEMLDLIRGRIDVVGDWPFVLLAHLATGVVQGRRHGVEGAGQTLLLRGKLRGDLGGRLLARRIDEFTRLVLRLANDLRSLTTHVAAAAGAL